MKFLKFFLAGIFFVASTAHAAVPTWTICCITPTVVGTNEIDLSWTGPATASDYGITYYKIEREFPVGGGFTTIVPNSGSTDTSYKDTNLSPGVTYSYRVTAMNSDGAGAASTVLAAATTLKPAPPAPSGPPQNVTTTAVSGSQINVSWTAPQTGAAVTGYKIEREIDGGFLTLNANTGTTDTTYTDTNLSPGRRYGYRITGLNSGGPGNPSVEAATYTYIPPVAPGNVAVVGGDTQATVSWVAPPAAGIINYIITTFPGNTTSSAPVAATSTIVTGLVNGMWYSFTVAAVNPAGVGAAAATNTIQVKAAVSSTTPTSIASTSTPVIAPTATSTATTPSTSATFIFTASLRVGSRGTAVTELQKRLIKENFLSADSQSGYFGLKTRAAVVAFQKAHGIAPVGSVGPTTRAYLNAHP